MRWLLPLLVVGCVARPAPEPATLLACPVIETGLLRRCSIPPLPQESGEAVLAIWQALEICHLGALHVIEQIEGE